MHGRPHWASHDTSIVGILQKFISHPHLVTSKIPKTFDTFKIFKTRKFHKIQTLRNFACPPSFDFAYSSVRPHAKKTNSFTVLRLISVIMSAHFWGYITCYEPTSHIEVEHTVGSTTGKNRTPFSGPEAVSFFCSFRD